MIPGAFAYHRPKSLAEAVGLLADLGEDARPLAGGHSLIPMMKLRLAAPEHLVDLRAIGDLKGIRAEGGDIVIGAMTTQHEVIGSDLLAGKLPILRETSLSIADPQVRYVGTLGGNLANGDPGNDMPAVMLCLGATYHLAGKGGERRVAAREFYQGAYFTALEAGEILTAIRIPVPPAGHGHAYEKLKRKIGDYATAAAAVILTLVGRQDRELRHRPHQCRRDAALRRGGRQAPDRLGPRAGHREAGRGRGGGHHRARVRQSGTGGLSAQDGGSHDGPRLGGRQSARVLRGDSIWPRPRSR